MPRCVRDLLAGAAALIAASLAPAAAAPIVLADEAAIDRFAEMIAAYRDVARVRWQLSVPSEEERERVVRRLAAKLGHDAPMLLARVRAEVPQATRAINFEPATAEVAIAPPTPAKASCSWSVTVQDPDAPSKDVVSIPLERGDTLPTSPRATFRIGFSGPLQSTLYAFGETGQGEIRDLAAAPEITMPVAAAGSETLVLVRARKPVPFLESIRDKLASTPGQRAGLGPDSALATRFQSASRGIGANIQLVDPSMIVANGDPIVEPVGAEPEVATGSTTRAGDELAETCLYTLTTVGG